MNIKKMRGWIIALAIVVVLALPIVLSDRRTFNNIDDNETFLKVINSDKVNMVVFGQDTCIWCTRFKVSMKAVVKKYDLDNIYYVNLSTLKNSEWDKILDSDLMIPESCTKEDKDAHPISEGFGTPLTIFTKNGESIDCIGGHVDADKLAIILKSVNIIE